MQEKCCSCRGGIWSPLSRNGDAADAHEARRKAPTRGGLVLGSFTPRGRTYFTSSWPHSSWECMYRLVPFLGVHVVVNWFLGVRLRRIRLVLGSIPSVMTYWIVLTVAVGRLLEVDLSWWLHGSWKCSRHGCLVVGSAVACWFLEVPSRVVVVVAWSRYAVGSLNGLFFLVSCVGGGGGVGGDSSPQNPKPQFVLFKFFIRCGGPGPCAFTPEGLLRGTPKKKNSQGQTCKGR